MKRHIQDGTELKEFKRQDICPNCKWEGEFRLSLFGAWLGNKKWIKDKICKNCEARIVHSRRTGKYVAIYVPRTKRGNPIRNFKGVQWMGKHKEW